MADEVMDAKTPIRTQAELREEYGQISPLAEKKVLTFLDTFCRDFIAMSPFLVLASSDADGRADAEQTEAIAVDVAEKTMEEAYRSRLY